jgi:hypothetical protein
MSIRGSMALAGPVVAVTVLAVVLTGCSGGSAGPRSSPSESAVSAPFVTANDNVVTCADWIGFTNDEKSVNPLRFIDEETIWFGVDASVVVVDDEVSVFLADGTVLSGHIDVIDWACAHVTSDTRVDDDDAVNFLSAASPDYGYCHYYLELPQQSKEAWIAVAKVAHMREAAGATVEDMDTLCGDQPDDRFNMAIYDYRDRLADLALPRVHWSTVSQLGYTFSATMTVGAVGDGGTGHPGAPSFQPGDACGFDAATDAFLPLTLEVINATAGYEAKMQSGWILRTASPETVTVLVEANYSDGPKCSYPDDYTGNVATGTLWNEPIASGKSGRGVFFIILKNYFSPRYPTGNTADLAELSITGTSYTNDEDPVVSLTSEEWTLAGVQVN